MTWETHRKIAGVIFFTGCALGIISLPFLCLEMRIGIWLFALGFLGFSYGCLNVIIDGATR